MSKINETNYPRRTQANYEDTDMLVIQKAGGNTYTTRIEDLREDCQETLAPALDTMRENLATIEGSTASKAYAKGDYLVFGGRLCKAKTSIAVNATLILDTNIELSPVGDELSSISSDLANKQNKTWNVICNTSMATGAWTTINLSDHISYYNELYIRVFGYNTFVPVSDFVNTSSASPIVVGTNGSLDANIIMAGYLTDVKIHVYAGTTVSINPSPVIVMAR